MWDEKRKPLYIGNLSQPMTASVLFRAKAQKRGILKSPFICQTNRRLSLLAARIILTPFEKRSRGVD